jgi:hypothetical protein
VGIQGNIILWYLHLHINNDIKVLTEAGQATAQNGMEIKMALVKYGHQLRTKVG